jgi:hypothetical protein
VLARVERLEPLPGEAPSERPFAFSVGVWTPWSVASTLPFRLQTAEIVCCQCVVPSAGVLSVKLSARPFSSASPDADMFPADSTQCSLSLIPVLFSSEANAMHLCELWRFEGGEDVLVRGDAM